MGLDINFYAVKKTEIGSFRKVNFILTYFDIEEEDNAKDIVISKEQLGEFVAELRCELAQQNNFPSCRDAPVNPKFRSKEVFYGGSTAYDERYWDDLADVYKWANGILNSFNWEECELVINAWW